LSWLPNKDSAKEIVLENELVKFVLKLDKGVMLSSAIDKKTNVDYMQGKKAIRFYSQGIPLWLDDVGYQLFSIKDKAESGKVTVVITQRSSYYENPFIVTQTFSLASGHELSWDVLSENTAKAGGPYNQSGVKPSNIKFPVMQEMTVGREEDMHFLLPTFGGRSLIDNADDFVFYFTRAYDPKIPIDIYNYKENRGIYFQVLESSLDFSFTDSEDFQNKVFSSSQKPAEKTNILKCRIALHEGDWHAAFFAFKKHIRSNFDFQYYKRPVQEKYRQRLISHFTFLYGFDIYDPDKNIFRINEFLDEGEMNFGGYDYMLLWHDYQRMGIDDRDQFDLSPISPGTQ